MIIELQGNFNMCEKPTVTITHVFLNYLTFWMNELSYADKKKTTA